MEKPSVPAPPVAGPAVKKEMSESEKWLERLTRSLEKEYNASNAIKKEGTQIVIPEFMSVPDTIRTLQNYEKQREEITEKQFSIEGITSDILAAFYRAMKKTFGNLVGESQEVHSFFGSFTRPGQSKTIEIGFGESLTVPYGKVAVPGLPFELHIFEDEDHEPEESYNDMIMIVVKYLKKFEPLVEKIEKETRRELAENSIFKNKAFDSQFKFINLNGFPLNKIVYADQEEKDLRASIFRVIESYKEILKMGMSVKRTVLLHGRYGTGKTLTALLAANTCVKHGWTMISVIPGHGDISETFRVATKHQPSLVFFEDIDSITNGDRDISINEILNTIDGILSKSAQVMTILTTNNVKRIEKAMIRPGRIDAVIELGSIDEKMIRGLVNVYCGDQLQGEIDTKQLLKIAEGYTPAFIAEACNRAVFYSLERVKGNREEVKIKNEDLVYSLSGLRSQYELMIGQQEKSALTLDGVFSKMMSNAVGASMEMSTQGLVRKKELAGCALKK